MTSPFAPDTTDDQTGAPHFDADGGRDPEPATFTVVLRAAFWVAFIAAIALLVTGLDSEQRQAWLMGTTTTMYAAVVVTRGRRTSETRHPDADPGH